MEQYRRLKAQHPDAILLCRVGDFYEAFYEDAELISRVLEIVLTSKNEEGNGGKAPMAGVPYHALDSHLYKLVRAGYKVAVSEQMEDPKEAKGLIHRDIVRIVTPGTLTDPKALDHKINNYLIGIYPFKGRYGLAAADLSTGEFTVTELENPSKLWPEIHRLAPKECLFSENFDNEEMLDRLRADLKVVVNFLPEWRFAFDAARTELLQHFKTLSLDGFGCEHLPAAICAAGALIYYLYETQKQEVKHILSLHTYAVSDFMILDADTQRNLELAVSIRDGSSKGTLLEVLDETVTSMGGRKLRQCCLQPLLQLGQINARLDAVDELKRRIGLQEELRERLSKMYDMERLIARMNLGSANARDLLALKDSLRLLPGVKEQLADCEASLLKTLYEALDPMAELADLIETAIHPEPPITVREGGLIRDGYNVDLDRLRGVTSKGKNWIAELQQKEQERTGIERGLKIGFNQVFGYYIEVTKPNFDRVPDDYIRKQTLVNAERFVTEELKERESEILRAQDSIHTLEYDLFCDIRRQVAQATDGIQKAAAVVAMIDVIAALAYIASKYDYAKPIIDESDEIIIRNGRHPVVERLFTREGFVPNDTELNCRDKQMHIITGPNMSGKSTYLRQTALITLMAQMGSFAPASAAKIGIVDRIFTRVGASDNLVMGQSTFLVEMNETANILNNATRKSLIILDEIGRGTSTFDGLSIAWATAEYILDQDKIGAKTLFATHYHELIELAGKYKNVKNYNVVVHEDEETITFLRKVVEGGTDQSYGIHVARLAGLPQAVIDRANQILEVLEQHNLSIEAGEANPSFSKMAPRAPRPRRRISRSTFKGDALQLALFTPKTHPVVEEIRAVDINHMTPMDALNFLYHLKAKAESS
jgi:DNA mismatch repair protein MutS